MKSENKQYWKRVVQYMIAISFIGIAYIFYCYFFGFTIYNVIKYAFLADGKYNEYISKYMKKDIFKTFNNNDIIKKNFPVKKHLKLYMLFAANDIFHKGIVWMYYSFEIRDINNRVITGSWNVPMRIDLHKEKGHWKIIRISEAP